jgi:diguanylate cyclase (GGDEF)-like protein
MAFTIRNLKIRQQILLFILPPLFVLLCAVGLAFFAYWSVANSNRESSLSRERVARNQSFWGHVSQIYFAVQKFTSSRQPGVMVSYDQWVNDALTDLTRLSDLEASDPDHLREVAGLRTQFEEFRSLWAQPAIALAGAPADSTAVMAEGQQRFTAMAMATSKLRRKDEEQKVNEMQTAERLMWEVLVAGVSLAVLMGVMLIVLKEVWTRQIEAPVLALIRASEQVGRGDLTPAPLWQADNEFGALSRSFFRMTAALRREREEVASLTRFSEAAAQCTTEVEVYDLLLHSLKERFLPTQIIIFKLQSRGSFLEAVATLVPLPGDVRARPVIEEPHDCKAVRAGRSFMANDVRVQALCPSKFALPSEGGYFCGPLIAGGINIGSVRMHTAADVCTADRQRVLESYLSGAASALANLRHLGSMEEQANFDALTGLYNRRFMQDYAQKQFAIARRDKRPVGLLLLDLDHFKHLNDTYGHAIGDCVLRHFAKTVSESIRESNLFARYGGEEFVFVLSGASAESCALVAERIRTAVTAMVVPSDTETPLPQVTVSIGVAAFPEHGEALEDVIQAADKALYESKRGGRNRVTVAPARWPGTSAA